MVPLAYFQGLSGALFAIGLYGVLARRSAVLIMMSIELMLNAVNLTFVALSYYLRQLNGQIFVFFVMVVAAAEAAIGLAIILTVFKNRQSLNVDRMDVMKF